MEDRVGLGERGFTAAKREKRITSLKDDLPKLEQNAALPGDSHGGKCKKETTNLLAT